MSTNEPGHVAVNDEYAGKVVVERGTDGNSSAAPGSDGSGGSKAPESFSDTATNMDDSAAAADVASKARASSTSTRATSPSVSEHASPGTARRATTGSTSDSLPKTDTALHLPGGPATYTTGGSPRRARAEATHMWDSPRLQKVVRNGYSVLNFNERQILNRELFELRAAWSCTIACSSEELDLREQLIEKVHSDLQDALADSAKLPIFYAQAVAAIAPSFSYPPPLNDEETFKFGCLMLKLALKYDRP